MLFVIHALDRPGALPDRLAHLEAHRAFLTNAAAHSVTIVMAGPLIDDGDLTMIGSLLLVEAPDRATVEQFNQADPLYAAHIWATVTITRFNRRLG
jgi:uncharacterized protein YciI